MLQKCDAFILGVVVGFFTHDGRLSMAVKQDKRKLKLKKGLKLSERHPKTLLEQFDTVSALLVVPKTFFPPCFCCKFSSQLA